MVHLKKLGAELSHVKILITNCKFIVLQVRGGFQKEAEVIWSIETISKLV